MNRHEEIILNEIINYLKENQRIPTMRYLQRKLSYKSVNSISEYIKSLEKQNYLIRSTDGKIKLNKYYDKYESGIKIIKILNTKKDYVHLLLEKNDKYVAYKMHNSCFNNLGIYKNDILIINISKKLKNKDLGLFIIDNQYRIMQYNYKDGFYILKDYEELLLNKVKIIGKVIMVEKKLWLFQSFNNSTYY